MLDADILSEAGEQLRESRARVAELQEELLDALLIVELLKLPDEVLTVGKKRTPIEKRIAELEGR